MHDPMTVAFEIRYPWRAYPRAQRTTEFNRTYRNSFITIWHVDPECDGSDDSCGWFAPKHDERTWAKYQKLGEREYVFMLGEHGYPMTCYEAVWYAWLKIKQVDRGGWRKLTQRERDEIRGLASFPGDNLRYSHSTISDPASCGAFFRTVFRCYARIHRPWYRHPRWHFWHWRIQVHPLQNFKRWAFSRCCKCGGRFKWGYAPCTNSWNGSGPRWFQNEPSVYHVNCDDTAKDGAQNASASAATRS